MIWLKSCISLFPENKLEETVIPNAAGLQEGNVGGDADFLDQPADVEREIEAQGLSQLHGDSGSHDTAEAIEFDGEDVHPDGQRQEVIPALFVGRALEFQAGVGVLRHHSGTGQRSALHIAHDT
jgi:hypothetical protein